MRLEQDVVKLLLQRGAGVNSKDKDDITALMEASIMDHRDVVKHLLKVRAGSSCKHRDPLPCICGFDQEQQTKSIPRMKRFCPVYVIRSYLTILSKQFSLFICLSLASACGCVQPKNAAERFRRGAFLPQ